MKLYDLVSISCKKDTPCYNGFWNMESNDIDIVYYDIVN